MSRRCFSVANRSLVLLIASIGFIGAPTAASDREAAEELVAEALHRQVYGLQSDRDRLLAKAVNVDPNYGPARWHQGFVRVGAEWSQGPLVGMIWVYSKSGEFNRDQSKSDCRREPRRSIM